MAEPGMGVVISRLGLLDRPVTLERGMVFARENYWPVPGGWFLQNGRAQRPPC